MKMLGSLLLAAVVAASAEAQHLNCGSSVEVTERQRELGIWAEGRARVMAAKGFPAATASLTNNVYVLPADETNSPFLRPFDLVGRSLFFTRTGPDGFRVRNAPLLWIEPGNSAQMSVAAEQYAEIDLDFDFPFFDRTVRKIFASEHNGIFLSRPTTTPPGQRGDTDISAIRQPLIAPLLSTDATQLTRTASIQLKKSADSAVITWSVAGQYSVQAVLRSNGDVVFSYEEVGVNVAGSLIAITSGNEPWRTARTQLSAITDSQNDLRTFVPEPAAAMLDITGLSVDRVSNLDLMEVRITTRGPVTPLQTTSSDNLRYNVAIGTTVLRLTVNPDGTLTYQMSVWGQSGGARIEGNDLVLPVLRDILPLTPSASVSAFSYRGANNADSAGGLVLALGDSTARVRTDFSAIDERTLENAPIVEAFTLPIISVGRIWQQIREAAPWLTDADVDGVAIYQNFFTDIVTYAGAYSTGGNSASSGISQNDSSQVTRPRSPALMHMNKVAFGHNASTRGASHVVLHELGHRWLLRVTHEENGNLVRSLNPVSAHPAQYVDTRAAFNVYTDTDTSVMGGGYFTDNSDGSFRTSAYAAYGFSWLDLYLMGLASTTEVQPFFYLANSNPVLGDQYYAPSNQTFRGSRRDVTIEQIVTGTGPRVPAYPSTQRQFKVAFVLLADPSRPATEEELAMVRQYRGLIEADFRTATSGRGEVTTSVEPPPTGPRRRAVGR